MRSTIGKGGFMSRQELEVNVRKIIDFLEKQEDGYAISTWEVTELLNIDTGNSDRVLWDIHDALFETTAAEGKIMLDMSTHEEMCEGLPYILRYVVRKIR